MLDRLRTCPITSIMFSVWGTSGTPRILTFFLFSLFNWSSNLYACSNCSCFRVLISPFSSFILLCVRQLFFPLPRLEQAYVPCLYGVLSFPILMNFPALKTSFPCLSLLLTETFSAGDFLHQLPVLIYFLDLLYFLMLFLSETFYLFFPCVSSSFPLVFWCFSPAIATPWVTYLCIGLEVGLVLGQGDFATTPPPLPLLPLNKVEEREGKKKKERRGDRGERYTTKNWSFRFFQTFKTFAPYLLLPFLLFLLSSLSLPFPTLHLGTESISFTCFQTIFKH